MTRFRLSVGALGRVSRERLPLLLEAIAIETKNAVVSEMEPGPTRTGRQYTIPGTARKYTASAPGQPPAIREGLYAASWKNTPAVRSGGRLAASAYSDLREGPWLLGELLEFGTSRMLPRPHIRPAIDRVLPLARALVREAGRA